MAGRRRSPRAGTDDVRGSDEQAAERNEVWLRGRVAASPEERELPSGDRIVSLRLIVPRDPASRRSRAGTGSTAKVRVQTVDTIDLVCWTARARRTAVRLTAGESVEVRGALRRRFFGGPSGRQSRYEVEVGALRRLAGRPTPAT